MNTDPRCCGSGTCIIDPEGRCWCGQQWGGEKMALPPLPSPKEPESEDEAVLADGHRSAGAGSSKPRP